MRALITYFIKYPVGGNIIAVAMIVLGLIAAFSVNSSYLPIEETKFIVVSATYPGASPREVEEGVVSKIEASLQGIYEIEEFSSNSFENGGRINIEVKEQYDTGEVLEKIKSACQQIPSYPSGLEPVQVYKDERFNGVLFLGIYAKEGKNLPLKTLKAGVDKIEEDLLSSGQVSRLNIMGAPDQQIEVSLKDENLRKYNITFDEVARVVRNSNILGSGGVIKTQHEYYQIRVKSKSYNAADLSDVIIKTTAQGAIVRLKDVAKVADKWDEEINIFTVNGARSLQMFIEASNSEDVIEVSEYVKKYLQRFNEQNQELQVEVLWDGGKRVADRVQLLLENALVGFFLVLVFLAIFLRPSMALWVALGLPVAFLGMFLLAPWMGITINMLSLFGMIIVIGILVDDGIVIAENIYAHYEEGKPIFQAAIDGTMEVVTPIVSSILTTVVAFCTFFFLSGVTIFADVSKVVISTLLISLIEALIILPMHIAHSKRLKNKPKKPFILNYYAEKILLYFRDRVYLPTLRFVLDHPIFGISIPVAALLLTLAAIKLNVIGQSFFPKQASNRLTISLVMVQGTNPSIAASIVSAIEKKAWELNEILRSKNNDKLPVRLIRTNTWSSSAELRVYLKEDRKISIGEFANALEAKVGMIPQVEKLVYGTGRNFGGSPVSITLKGRDSQELWKAKEELKKEMLSLPQLKNIQDQNALGKKELNINLKEKGRLLGLTISEVIKQIRYAFFGYEVQRFHRGRDEVKVWIRYDRSERTSIQNLEDMLLTTQNGNRIPFDEVADYQISRGASSIHHLNGKRTANLSADLRNENDAEVEVLNYIKDNIVSKVLAKYPGISMESRGQSERAGKVTGSIYSTLPYILILMYIIIAFSFRSYSQPIILLIIVPFNIVGIAWGHWIHGVNLGIFSYIGIVALVGIVVNDGLVFIGKFNGFLRKNLAFKEAMIKAGKSRFRAILLTSITTVAGLAPIILDTSRDAMFLRPMAIAITYGIVIGTLITLLMLPLMLSFSNSIKFFLTWLVSGKKVPREFLERAIKEQKHLIER